MASKSNKTNVKAVAADGARPSLTAHANLSQAEFDLGKRVKSVRLERGLTLAEAANRAGLARSTLSKIENGHTSPTFEVLQKYAAGVGVAMDELLTTPKQQPPSGRWSITRVNEGQIHDSGAYTHEFLCTDLTQKNTVPSKARVKARSPSEFGAWIRHEGDDFMYVIEGEVELHTEFYQPVRLKQGDSAYFDARMGHFCISVSEEDALVLWVPTRANISTEPYGRDTVQLPYL